MKLVFRRCVLWYAALCSGVKMTHSVLPTPAPALKPGAQMQRFVDQVHGMAVDAVSETGYDGWFNVRHGAKDLVLKPERLQMLTVDAKAPYEAVQSILGLAEAVFGIKPDVSSVTDVSSFYLAARSMMAGSAVSVSLDCQPTFRLWWRDMNGSSVAERDSAYHVMIFPSFGPNDLVVVEGTFPSVRYFSFHTFDGMLHPISLLVDADVQPLAGTGSNPFVTAPAGGQRARGNGSCYRVYLTKDGSKGFPNELAAAMTQSVVPAPVALVFRLVGSDASAMGAAPDLEAWGGVPPIKISAKISGSLDPQVRDQAWHAFEKCPQNNTIAMQHAITAIRQLLPSTANRTCPVENLDNSFMLVTDKEQFLPSGACSWGHNLLDTDDACAVTCADMRAPKLRGKDLIATLRVNLPMTPTGAHSPPRIADHNAYAARSVSISVRDLDADGRIVHTLDAEVMRSFYHNLYGASHWERRMHRNVSIIVTTDRHVLKRCNVDMSNSLIVDLAEAMRRGSRHFGIMYRELQPQANSVVQAASRMNNVGFQTKRSRAMTLHEARRHQCQVVNGQVSCDVNPHSLAGVMGSYAPHVEYSMCSKDGKLLPVLVADPWAQDSFALGRPITHGSMTAPDMVRSDTCDIMGVNEGTFRIWAPRSVVMVYLPSTAANGRGSQANKAVSVPAKMGLWKVKTDPKQSHVVVGVSIKTKSAPDALFIAELETCEGSYVSSPHWRCMATTPATPSPATTSAWLQPDFHERGWQPAIMVGRTDAARATFGVSYWRRFISQDARFVHPAATTFDWQKVTNIASNDRNSSVERGNITEILPQAFHCRIVVPNPAFTGARDSKLKVGHAAAWPRW